MVSMSCGVFAENCSDIICDNYREAWHKLGNGVSKEVAMSRYVELVGRVDPEWETQPLDTSQQVSW